MTKLVVLDNHITVMGKQTMFHLTNMDREHILDAIQDVLRELEEEPLVEYVSQGCIDKLISAQEILDDEQRHLSNTRQSRPPGVR